MQVTKHFYKYGFSLLLLLHVSISFCHPQGVRIPNLKLFFTINYIRNIHIIEHFYQLEKLIYLMFYTRNIQVFNLKWTYFNMSNLFTKIYNVLYYTTNLYLQ